MSKSYSLVPRFDNSWHVKHGDEIIAHVEGVEKMKDGKQVTKGIFKKKAVHEYIVTNLPGADGKTFLTVHSAATHAVNHHTKGEHTKHPHPLTHIKRGIQELERAIWHAASDPRMDNHQEKLLELSKSHANAKKIFNKHFGDNSTKN